MKIVFFGTSNVALPILEVLDKHHDIALIVTTPDAPVGKKRIMQESPVSALANDLDIKVLKPERVKNNDDFKKQLENVGADIFVVVSYGKILPEEVINIPRLKTLNVHFSLLPKYRGAAPIQFALINGEETTGTSIFILDKDMDHGPILAQGSLKVEPDDTFFTLADRSARLSATLLVETLEKYNQGAITPVEQDHAAATYTKIISKEDGLVNWDKSAQEIYNLFRGFYPWPGIWTKWKNTNLKILACHPLKETRSGYPAGTVTAEGDVICKDGTMLRISELQLAGKNACTLSSFLNGYKDFPGSLLGQ